MKFNFEKQLVYQKAVDSADAVCAASERLPHGYGFLVNCEPTQSSVLFHSGEHRGRNGRFTKADPRNFFGIARGSVQECVPLLELARRRGTLSPEQHTALKSDLEVISRMLTGVIKGPEYREV
jgi:four helix bundle protein